VSEESPLAKPQGYEPCEECGAPLDPQQRYCVECAARRGNGSNPASRYFAAMSKKSRRPLTKSQAKGSSGGGSRAAAVGFFALLPIAVALGVVVGRSDGSGDSNEDALLKALHQAEQQQVAAAPVITEEAAPTTASTTKNTKAAAKGAKKSDKAAAKNEAKNAAKNAGTNATKSKQGAVEKIETYKPSKEDVEEDTKLVEENPEQTGENYIKAQQNLPEVIVIGGEEEGSSSGSELPPGVEP
jgi:hypothetical protein